MSNKIPWKAIFAVGFLSGVMVVGAVTFASSDAVTVSDGVTVGAPDGMNATITGQTDAIMETDVLFPTSDTVQFKTEDGNLTFQAAGSASATVDISNITGTWTNITSIDAASNDITIDPEDKLQATVGKQINHFAWRSGIVVDDSTVDFVYGGTTGSSKVTVRGVTANTQLGAVDVDSGTLLDGATSNNNGVVTFDSLSNSVHRVRLVTSEGDPSVSEIKPSGKQSSNPTQISANITDPDFTASGDTVTVNFSLDGTQIDSQTISSQQIVTTSMPASGQTGGEHTITVTATDSYGRSASGSATYQIPSTLSIRDETNYSQLVPANGEVRFIASNQVYTRTTSDGTLDLAGLPVDENFIVDVNPTKSNYTDRTIYIQSIYEQQTAYVLNTSAYQTVTTRFVLNDPTAQYGPQSVLQIQKAINISGNLTYETIKADRFGVEGVTSTLHKDQRYQLKIIGENSEQVVGVYRSEIDGETVTVQPGSPTIDLGGLEDGFGYNAQLDNRTLEYVYSDPAQQTDKLIVWIHERGNQSNKLQPNQTAFDIGNFSGIVSPQLTANESKKEWMVNFVITRNGETFTASVIVSNNENLTPPIASGWVAIIGVGLLILLAGVFSQLNAAIGAVVVSLVGGVLWYIGFLGTATTGAAVVIAIFLSAIMYMYKGAYP